MANNKETAIQKKILDSINKHNLAKLFRNNCGAVDLGGGRLMRFGVGGKGASDLIGYKSVVVTPDMVGKKIAVFTAFEVKTPTGKVSADQNVFIQTVQSYGGIAGIVRSVDDALKLLGLL